MELFRNPNIDFLGKKALFLAISALAILGSIASLAIYGLQYGIDFRGGADVVLRFADEPSLDQIRDVLGASGLGGAQIQALGTRGEKVHDVLIRVPPVGDGEEQGDVSGQVIAALRSSLRERAGGAVDLNIAGAAELRRALSAAFPRRETMVDQAADAIVDYRNRNSGLIASIDDLVREPGVPAEVGSWLRDNAVAGGFAIRSADYVGPSVGRDLKRRASYAIIGSLVVMLIYVSLRFHQFAFGLAGILTLAHDAIVALGAVSITGKEFDLTVLAAILTIVGFSINDTIVIFDRVRENSALRRGEQLERLFNDSINQTLGRTVLTTVLVMLTVMTLWIFGGSRLNPFSFTLLVGVISGVYSTIYISCPIVIWWRTRIEKKSTA